MAIIAPSILAADFVNLERDIHDIENSGSDWIHVDVMDGLFVPNISIGLPVLKAIRGVTRMPLDVHLMIDRPIRYVDQFIANGADWLTVHVESDTPENTMAALKKISAAGCKAGLSVKPGTSAEAVEPYLPYCDQILVMTVEPGFGGQKFMADMMPKLAKLREMIDTVRPGCVLSVDGGVDVNTAPACKANGANMLVTGSAYFKAADHSVFVRQIKM